MKNSELPDNFGDYISTMLHCICVTVFGVLSALLTSAPANASIDNGTAIQRTAHLQTMAKLDQAFLGFRLSPGTTSSPVGEDEHAPIAESGNAAGDPSSDPIPNSDTTPTRDNNHVTNQSHHDPSIIDHDMKRVRWKDVKSFEIAFQILNAVDGIETVYCLRRTTCSEGNPIIGRHPPAGRVIAVKAAAGVIHYAITRHLFKHRPEWIKNWAVTTVVLQGGVVLWNLQHCF